MVSFLNDLAILYFGSSIWSKSFHYKVKFRPYTNLPVWRFGHFYGFSNGNFMNMRFSSPESILTLQH